MVHREPALCRFPVRKEVNNVENILEILKEFIRPELIVLIPVLLLMGTGLKKAEWVKDKWIPLLLGAFGVALSLVYLVSVSAVTSVQEAMALLFTGVTQGVLCAGVSVYVHQLVKQNKKEN